jgi:hypothetical protein
MFGRTRAMPASMAMPAHYVPGWHNAPPGAQACPHCQGEGWWADRWQNIKDAASSVANFVKPVLKPIASTAANFIVPGSGAAVNAGLSALGLGKPRRISARMRERNEVVRHIMMERGVNLPTASRIVKQEGLF